MDQQQRMDATCKLLPVIRSLQLRPGARVPFSAVNAPLALAGVNRKDSVSFLLPPALSDEFEIDLTLVVERLPSGAYQGQTALPMEFAYSASRYIAPPSSDWLRSSF